MTCADCAAPVEPLMAPCCYGTRHALARQFLGVPFKHQGRNPAFGIDCVGLLRLWADACGLDLAEHDRTNYGKRPHAGLLEQHMEAAFGPSIPLASMQPDDVVAMAYGKPITHVGIIGVLDGRLSLIHTAQNVGRVTEHRIDAKFLKRIKRVYRPNWE